MATFPNLFQCKNPWTFRKGWLQNGAEAPAAAPEASNIEKLKELNQWPNLTEAIKNEIGTLIDQFVAKDGQEWFKTVQEVAVLATQLSELQDKINQTSDGATKARYENLQTDLLKKAEDLSLSQDEIETIQLASRQVDDHLELKEAHRQYKNGYIFMKKADGDRVNAESIDREFQESREYTVDFGKSEDPTRGAIREKHVSLNQMLPLEVTKVQVESKKYNETVKLVRFTDGKFRKAEAKATDKHYPIWDGDQVTVLERNNASAVEFVQQEAAPAAAPAPVAAEVTLSTPTNTPTEAPSAPTPSQERINAGLEVKYGEAIQFPPEFRGKTGSQIESMLATSDFGVQAKRALDTLNKMQGERASTIGLLEDMRTHNMFSKNRLGYEEIALRIFNTGIVDLQMEYGNITEKKKEEPLTAVEANRLAQLELFFLTIMDLKYAIESLKNRASESQETPVEDLTEEEKMLNMFFDKNDNGPVIKPSLRDWFHGQRRRTLSSDYTEGQETLENAIDSYTDNYSEAAAWNKIRVECSNAAGDLDPEKLRVELNRLLELGKVQAILLNHDLKNGLSRIDSTKRLNEIVGSPISGPQYKELIQLGFSKDLRDKAEAQEQALGNGSEIPSLTPEVNKNIQERTALYLGLIKQEGNNIILGSGFTKEIGKDDQNRPITLAFGVSGDTITRTITIGAGATLTVIQTDIVTIKAAPVISIGASGPSAGLALPTSSMPLGTKKIWSVQFTPSLGVNGLGVALGAALGVNRDLQAVYNEKVKQETSEINDSDLVKQLLENNPNLEADIKAIAEARGLDKMGSFQFKAAGIGTLFVPPDLFIPYPYFEIAIKNKTYRVFEDPSKYSSDEKIQAAISASQKKTAGVNSITVYESGPLLIDENGEYKMGKASIDRNPEEDALKSLEKINGLLKDKNMVLAPEADGRISLNVGNRLGNLKVYADPAGTVEIYPKNGKIYLNWDATESLSVERVDEWSSRMKENAYQNTLIYIGNKGMDTSSVITNSDSHIQMGGTLTEPTEMKDKEGTASLDTVKKNANDLGSEYRTFIPKDWVERQTLVNSIKNKVMSNDTLTLSEDQKTRITQAVNTLMSKDSTRQEYKHLSTEGNRRDLIDMLKKYNEENPWDDSDIKIDNEAELNSFLQAIMEASLLDLDTSRAERVKRSLEWNRSKMSKELATLGLDTGAAQSIADEFINNFNLAAASKTAIPEFSQIVIAVGTEGFEGTRSSSWRAGGELLGAIDVMTDARFSAIRENLPDNALTSSIGLQLLPAADLMFTTAELKELEAMVGTDNPNKESLAYKKFAEIVNTLYKNQTWTSPEGNVTITPDIFWKVGLYGKCLNYCEVYNTKLKVDVKGPEFETRSAQTLNYIESHPQANFIGLGGAVAVTPSPGGDQPGGRRSEGGIPEVYDPEAQPGDSLNNPDNSLNRTVQ